jgi:hypothetical protein
MWPVRKYQVRGEEGSLMSEKPDIVLSVRLDAETRELVRRLTQIEERTVGAVVRRAFRAYIAAEYPNGVPAK